MPISGGHVSGSHGFPAFIVKKAGEGTKYGLTTAQAEKFRQIYGSNVDVLFGLAKKNIKTKRKQ